MTLTKKQAAAIAAIVLAGLLAGGALLRGDRRASNEDAQQSAERAPNRGAAEDTADAHTDAASHAADSDHQGDQDERAERTVTLSDTQAREAGIMLQAAEPGSLQAAAEFAGEVRFNDDRTAHVVPRLSGVVERVAASLGDAVRKGQVLAVIASTALSDQRSELLTAQRRRETARATHAREKTLWQERISAEQDYLQAQAALQEADIAVRNASQKLAAVGAVGAGAADGALNRFEIRAPFEGTVVEKHLTLGEAVKEDASVFTVADLRTVWAEFNVAPKDLASVRVGQRARVSSSAFASQVEGTISYVGALLGEQTRTARARVTLTNPQGAWRPGLFVTVTVFGDDQRVPLTVAADAVQTLDDQPMVFKAVPGGFEASPIRIGRSDGRRVEVLGGLRAGDAVAGGNTFVLKSELGKAGAGHEH